MSRCTSKTGLYPKKRFRANRLFVFWALRVKYYHIKIGGDCERYVITASTGMIWRRRRYQPVKFSKSHSANSKSVRGEHQFHLLRFARALRFEFHPLAQWDWLNLSRSAWKSLDISARAFPIVLDLDSKNSLLFYSVSAARISGFLKSFYWLI